MQGLVGTFLVLGFFPALAFTLFSLSVVAVIGGSALAFAFFVCVSIISGAGTSFLKPTLYSPISL